MGKTNITDHETQGDVVLDRLSTTKTPAALKTPIAEFKKVHTAFKSAGGVVDQTKAARDLALQAVATADEALDKALDVLAVKMIGAQMTRRQAPFATFSKYAPSILAGLGYAEEAKEVTLLAAKVLKAKPPSDVAKAAQTCAKLAAAVTSAVAALTKPQLAYTKALTARDALLLSWTKSLTTLKRKALGEWADDVATYKTVFASPGAVQAPKKKSAKKSKAASKKAAKLAAAPAEPAPVQNGQTAPAEAAAVSKVVTPAS